MSKRITIDSTDEELMEAFERHRRNGNGESAGRDSDTPDEAAEREGWAVIRTIHQGTNRPGTPVLAQDAAGGLWVINDLDGPWAIQVATEEPATETATETAGSAFREKQWIVAVLRNDENSSDEELVQYFMSNGVSEQDARAWVAKRDEYMGKI